MLVQLTRNVLRKVEIFLVNGGAFGENNRKKAIFVKGGRRKVGKKHQSLEKRRENKGVFARSARGI